MTQSHYANQKIIITGGSSGIGLALARQLLAQGANVWLLARDESRLRTAWQSLDAVRPAQIMPLDVSDAQAVTHALSAWIDAHGAPDVLINCAGVARPGLVEDLALEHFRRAMEINYFGTIYSTKAVLPAMLARGSGQVINVSSVAGFLGIFGYAAYGPSKYAVRGFSDVLRAEMRGRGVRVSVVFPPDTQTPQLEEENRYKPAVLKILDQSNKVLSPDAVAQSILRGAARGRYIITPGFDSWFYFYGSNLLGNLTYRLMDFMVAQARRRAARDG